MTVFLDKPGSTKRAEITTTLYGEYSTRQARTAIFADSLRVKGVTLRHRGLARRPGALPRTNIYQQCC